MTDFRIEENLDFLKPMIHLSLRERYDDWDIYIGDKEIEIEINWNYGYDGSGSSSIFIPIDKLEELIAKVKNAKRRPKDD